MRSATERNSSLVACLVFSVALSLPANAFDLGDHDRARQALDAGEVIPLGAVLERVRRDFPGEVMEVELEHKKDRWVYEIKLLRPGGSLVKLLVDASNGTIITRSGRDGSPNRR
jgi:uncharacterized membrane protein YkoI